MTQEWQTSVLFRGKQLYYHQCPDQRQWFLHKAILLLHWATTSTGTQGSALCSKLWSPQSQTQPEAANNWGEGNDRAFMDGPPRLLYSASTISSTLQPGYKLQVNQNYKSFKATSHCRSLTTSRHSRQKITMKSLISQLISRPPRLKIAGSIGLFLIIMIFLIQS